MSLVRITKMRIESLRMNKQKIFCRVVVFTYWLFKMQLAFFANYISQLTLSTSINHQSDDFWQPNLQNDVHSSTDYFRINDTVTRVTRVTLSSSYKNWLTVAVCEILRRSKTLYENENNFRCVFGWSKRRTGLFFGLFGPLYRAREAVTENRSDMKFCGHSRCCHRCVVYGPSKPLELCTYQLIRREWRSATERQKGKWKWTRPTMFSR